MADHHPACSLKDQTVSQSAYAGDVSPIQVFAQLKSGGVLVDVRTPEEWQAGVPDVKGLVKISWKTNPNYEINLNFPQEFAAQNISKDTPVYFMCKGGGRSREAAMAMTAAGYKNCFNVIDGFEREQGWKNSQLPWKQG